MPLFLKTATINLKVIARLLTQTNNQIKYGLYIREIKKCFILGKSFHTTHKLIFPLKKPIYSRPIENICFADV